MGLDMYAYSVDKGKLGEVEPTELFYWRKFNALHGWMEDLYVTRGGTESFNCIPLKLEINDLNSLLEDAKNNKLVGREGFFWGSPEVDEEDLSTVAVFVAKAKDEIGAGRDVYYDSWW